MCGLCDLIILKFLLQNICTDINTLVTDIYSRRARNQLAHLPLSLVAEGTSHIVAGHFRCHRFTPKYYFVSWEVITMSIKP